MTFWPWLDRLLRRASEESLDQILDAAANTPLAELAADMRRDLATVQATLGSYPGAVGWVSFRHHTGRPTLAAQDGRGGAAYLADLPINGDPHAHINNALFDFLVADDARIGSLDTKQLTKARVHQFGTYIQAHLADELRTFGARIRYDRNEQAIVLDAIPERERHLQQEQAPGATQRQGLRRAPGPHVGRRSRARCLTS